jgi:tetratricopeptide (TPR) repeat protein
MNAKSQEHVMFAYYESSQVVEYLIETHGLEKLLGVLRDLAAGKRINDALETNVGELDDIEKGFTQFITAKAKGFGALADWEEPKPEDLNPFDEGSFVNYLKKHPNNLPATRKHAQDMVTQKNWPEVLRLADKLIELLPDSYDADSGYMLKTMALRQMKREDEEVAVLRQVATNSSSAQSTFLRLIELDLPKQRWAEVKANAQRATALNPFLVTPQKALGEANMVLKLREEAIAAYERVLVLDPGSAAQTHFKLAQLWKETDTAKAKRHLMDSLALAPRNREGLAMLQAW